ncbi:MAG TPA: ABC transporter permease [Candidatus Lokiarchaeia archaeon]|nr:ABC transporter permease [Candidatus Lokiarchaeia archaeon]
MINLAIMKRRAMKSGWRLFSEEFLKNLRITSHGPTKAFVAVGIFVPLVFILFMFAIFGTGTVSYTAAVVVQGYPSDAAMQTDLSGGHLPYTQELINSFNTTASGGGSVTAVGTSVGEFLDAFHGQSIDLIIVLPPGFDQSIAKDVNHTWTGGNVTIDLYIANVNEDFTEIIEHGVDQRLNAYYNTILATNVRANFTAAPVNPGQPTLPQLWSLGSSSLMYGLLVVSVIIGAAYIFNEKQARMLPELAIASTRNQSISFTGKFAASIVFPMVVDFPVTLALVELFTGIPLSGEDLLVTAGVAALVIMLGTGIGMLIGAAVPELVYAVPAAIFLVLASIFLCGGFQDLRTFPVAYQQVVDFIPFTYAFSLAKVAMLGVGIWQGAQLAGLVAYIGVFFVAGLLVYHKRVIRG